MDFRFEQDRQDLQERVSKFCDEYCSASLTASLEESTEFPAGLYAAMGKEGLLKACLPQELGGDGGGVLDAVLITETLARSSRYGVNMFLVNAVFSGNHAPWWAVPISRRLSSCRKPLFDPPSQHDG